MAVSAPPGAQAIEKARSADSDHFSMRKNTKLARPAVPIACRRLDMRIRLETCTARLCIEISTSNHIPPTPPIAKAISKIGVEMPYMGCPHSHGGCARTPPSPAHPKSHDI